MLCWYCMVAGKARNIPLARQMRAIYGSITCCSTWFLVMFYDDARCAVAGLLTHQAHLG
jgi:hypothetical protein